MPLAPTTSSSVTFLLVVLLLALSTSSMAIELRGDGRRRLTQLLQSIPGNTGPVLPSGATITTLTGRKNTNSSAPASSSGSGVEQAAASTDTVKQACVFFGRRARKVAAAVRAPSRLFRSARSQVIGLSFYSVGVGALNTAFLYLITSEFFALEVRVRPIPRSSAAAPRSPPLPPPAPPTLPSRKQLNTPPQRRSFVLRPLVGR